MTHRSSLLSRCLVCLAAIPAVVPLAQAAPGVQEIIDRNTAARGGVAAWHDVKTLTFEGKLDAGGKPSHELPFVLRQKRPHKNRLEVVFKDQAAVQVYDGTQGWKVRPFLNRNEVEPFTPAEARIAAQADDLDGPLVDYQAKGTKVSLLGTEPVEGHPAYKLQLLSREGIKRNVWIDTTSFLEVRIDGEPRKLDGKMHSVALYFKDYRSEQGLNVPHLQETVVEGVKDPYKMTITKVTVNEPLADTLFQKPQLVATTPDIPAVARLATRPATAPVKPASGKP